MNDIIKKTGSGVALSIEVCEKIASIERQAKEIKRQQDELNKSILKAMQEKNVLSIDNEVLKITLIPEHTAERFDSKTFRDENPDVYDMYVKISKVKPSIRITVK